MKIVISIIIIYLLFSCNNKENISGEYKNVKLTESISDDVRYTLIFPDTLRINKSYNAIFKFDSPFDKIVEPFEDTVNFRTITFFYYNPIEIGRKNKNGLMLKDSILISNKEFVLQNIKFSKKGNFLFLAMIEDQIMYNFYNKVGKRDSIHIERKIMEIKKEIVIIE